MGAAYSFVSAWDVPVPASRCWSEIVRMISMPAPGADSIRQTQPVAESTWWPALTIAERPRAIEAGERMTLVVRSPVGYRLRVHLTLTDVVDGRMISAASTGDLRGAGSVEVRDAGEAASVVTFRWDVATERRWMNATAFVLRPVFERAHAHVMREGERGLRAALSAR